MLNIEMIVPLISLWSKGKTRNVTLGKAEDDENVLWEKIISFIEQQVFILPFIYIYSLILLQT